MAANDEFPRGWTLNTTQDASGVAAIISIPGIAGVEHILTDLEAKWITYGTVTVATQHIVMVLFGGTVIWQDLITIPASANVSDTVGFSGKKFIAPIGIGITIQFDAGPVAGAWETLTAAGYDI